MPGQPRQGRIVYVSPTISAETRTTKVRVALPNADLVLKPGMYATIRIRAAARRDVLSVPRSAVLVTGKRVLVFVKGGDGMLTPREVTLGDNTDERVEILHGLSAGETVVSSATFLIDAESNLGSALAGMANMPGMDHPAKKP
jgi:membrane fusion protein, copper/silver efflux system